MKLSLKTFAPNVIGTRCAAKSRAVLEGVFRYADYALPLRVFAADAIAGPMQMADFPASTAGFDMRNAILKLAVEVSKEVLLTKWLDQYNGMLYNHLQREDNCNYIEDEKWNSDMPRLDAHGYENIAEPTDKTPVKLEAKLHARVPSGRVVSFFVLSPASIAKQEARTGSEKPTVDALFMEIVASNATQLNVSHDAAIVSTLQESLVYAVLL